MRHVLGDGGRGSIITASPFSYGSAIGVPAVDYVQRQQYELLLYEKGDAVIIEPRSPSPSTCRLCARSSRTLFRPQASGDSTRMQSVLGESRAWCRSRVGSNSGSQQQQYEELVDNSDGSHIHRIVRPRCRTEFLAEGGASGGGLVRDRFSLCTQHLYWWPWKTA